jgi:hypothetical protein
MAITHSSIICPIIFINILGLIILIMPLALYALQHGGYPSLATVI